MIDAFFSVLFEWLTNPKYWLWVICAAIAALVSVAVFYLAHTALLKG